MAKTLREIAYSILELVSNFEITDDSPISLPWIEDQVISQNHTLIRKAKEERRLDSFLYMSDDNIEVKEFTPYNLIPGINVRNCHRFMYADIKPLLTGLQGAEIDFVSNSGYSSVYKKVPMSRLLRGSSGYYSLGNSTYALLEFKLVFLKSELDGVKYVSMSGIFNDPRTLSSWNINEPFRTPSEKNLELLSIQHILKGLGLPMDLMNDAQRTYSQTKPQSDE